MRFLIKVVADMERERSCTAKIRSTDFAAPHIPRRDVGIAGNMLGELRMIEICCTVLFFIRVISPGSSMKLENIFILKISKVSLGRY
jgi:hypothetical protein